MLYRGGCWAPSNCVAIQTTINFVNSNNEVLATYSTNGLTVVDKTYAVPAGCTRINIVFPNIHPSGIPNLQGRVYEIEPSNEPLFNATDGYMLLHADPTKSIKKPYQMVSINYFPTSVERLYRVGEDGEWLKYQDKPIWVNHGETIYAKGIDKYGNETRILSEYTANVDEALKSEALDGDENTYDTYNSSTKIINVDSSLIGKNIRLLYRGGCWAATNCLANQTTINFVNSNNEVLATYSTNGLTVVDKTYAVPAGCTRINIVFPNIHPSGIPNLQGRVYEIGPAI